MSTKGSAFQLQSTVDGTKTNTQFFINESKDSLTIEYKWNRGVGAIVLAFSLFVAVFAFYRISSTNAQEQYFSLLPEANPIFSVSIVLFLLALMLVTLFGVYLGLCGLSNKIRIAISPAGIRIHNTPFPYFDSKNVKAEQIDQLYSKRMADIQDDNSVIFRYQLRVITKKGKDILLLNDLENAEDSKFLEQKIEGFLNISDKAVEGEL